MNTNSCVIMLLQLFSLSDIAHDQQDPGRPPIISAIGTNALGASHSDDALAIAFAVSVLTLLGNISITGYMWISRER